MPPITIYTKATCPYCHAAKDLLRKKNAPFEEISVDGDRDAQAAMAVRAGGRIDRIERDAPKRSDRAS